MPTTVVSVRCVSKTGQQTQAETTEAWTYLVEFSDANGTAAQARTANDGTGHPGSSIPTFSARLSGTTLRVTNITANQMHDQGDQFWTVVVTFSTAQQHVKEEKPEGTNVKWDLQFGVTGAEWSEEATVDVDGNPVQNSVGDPLTPGLQETHYDARFSISYKTDSIDPATIGGCRGKANNAALSFAWNGATFTFETYELKCTQASYRTIDDSGGLYWQVDVELQQHVDLWTTHVVDKGYRYRPSAGAAPVTSDTLVYLADDGTKLPDETEANMLAFNTVEVADLSALLPSSMIVTEE